jgi:3',5'-cyclic AMP phosphodiesterase CpdA
MNRREFLGVTAAALSSVRVAAAAETFSFVHFTDLHIQPELRADAGCRACVAAMNAARPDFAICGGDLVFDAAAVAYPRAKQLYDLYAETLKPLSMPVHTVPGNHDVFAGSKQMFVDRIGPRYASFDHKGWHFVLLDSIGSRPGQDFIGIVDDDQLTWLKNDLAHLSTGTPLVVVTHVPLASSVLQLVADSWKTADTYLVTNAREVLELLWPYKPIAVLQGHTHIRETVEYNGCRFITSGAVCGNWWKGPREGHPEGFGLVTVHNGELTWRYQTYGFVASPDSSARD